MVLDDALRQQKSKPKAGVAAGAGSTGTDRWQIMKLSDPPSSGSVFCFHCSERVNPLTPTIAIGKASCARTD